MLCTCRTLWLVQGMLDETDPLKSTSLFCKILGGGMPPMHPGSYGYTPMLTNIDIDSHQLTSISSKISHEIYNDTKSLTQNTSIVVIHRYFHVTSNI